jgi:hypothetical protein
MEVGTILDLVTVALLAVGAMLWGSFRQAVREQVTEAVTRMNWSEILGRELEKFRGITRQELRFDSYGNLWALMRPLAIYDDTPINRKLSGEMLRSLSDWYFSASGGLMLTTHNRDLYFALQDLLWTTSKADQDWSAERPTNSNPDGIFAELMEKQGLDQALALKKWIDETDVRTWPGEELRELAQGWHEDIKKLAARWQELDEPTKFAVLQQACSILRTGLANDVESRLR